MDSLTTPTRVNRLLIPGLDTKSPVDDMATTITYAGLHTPPQSAHESRRPSIQSSWSDVAYSAGACGFPCSLPTTPVHRIQKSHDSFLHGWSDANMGSPTTGSRHLDPHVVNSGLPNQGYITPTVHEFPTYRNEPHSIGTDVFDLDLNSGLASTEEWTRARQSSNAFVAQAPCLESELFAMTQSLPSETTFPGTLFPHTEPALHKLNVDFDVVTNSPVHDHGASQGSLYNHPLVIVPSQLSPQEVYDHSHLNERPSFGNDTNEMPKTFVSATGFFDSFEALDPPSPAEAYFDHSEDDDYLLVKTEEISFNPRTHRSATSRRSSAVSKRRSSKRPCNVKRLWHRHETGGIEVQCEGKQFRLDRPVKYEAGNDRKRFACTHIMDGERCTRAFDRAEHLKRHVGSHTKERPYECPIDKCGKRIQRPDNACDHFKTHLRPPKKGKRNCYIEWLDLQLAIWEKFEDKTRARKLLDNLTSWVERGMPDASGRVRRD